MKGVSSTWQGSRCLARQFVLGHRDIYTCLFSVATLEEQQDTQTQHCLKVSRTANTSRNYMITLEQHTLRTVMGPTDNECHVVRSKVGRC